MATTIAHALGRVKDDLPRMIERHVMAYLAEHADRRWRRRLLDPLTTVLLFSTQVLHGNTAIRHLRHLSGMAFTATAYCKARRRLPLELLEQVGRRIAGQLPRASEEASTWRGHRMWRADATASRCPTSRSCVNASASRAGRPPGAASRWRRC